MPVSAILQGMQAAVGTALKVLTLMDQRELNFCYMKMLKSQVERVPRELPTAERILSAAARLQAGDQVAEKIGQYVDPLNDALDQAEDYMEELTSVGPWWMPSFDRCIMQLLLKIYQFVCSASIEKHLHMLLQQLTLAMTSLHQYTGLHSNLLAWAFDPRACPDLQKSVSMTPSGFSTQLHIPCAVYSRQCGTAQMWQGSPFHAAVVRETRPTGWIPNFQRFIPHGSGLAVFELVQDMPVKPDGMFALSDVAEALDSIMVAFEKVEKSEQLSGHDDIVIVLAPRDSVMSIASACVQSLLGQKGLTVLDKMLQLLQIQRFMQDVCVMLDFEIVEKGCLLNWAPALFPIAREHDHIEFIGDRSAILSSEQTDACFQMLVPQSVPVSRMYTELGDPPLEFLQQLQQEMRRRPEEWLIWGDVVALLLGSDSAARPLLRNKTAAERFEILKVQLGDACPQPRSDWICPVSQEIMTDPVSSTSGWPFEHSVLLKHFDTQRKLNQLNPSLGWFDPKRNKLQLGPTGEPVIVPNPVLRSMIGDWLEDLERGASQCARSSSLAAQDTAVTKATAQVQRPAAGKRLSTATSTAAIAPASHFSRMASCGVAVLRSALDPEFGQAVGRVDPECGRAVGTVASCVWSTAWAFLAELADGEVVAWGGTSEGGDISRVKSQLAKGIRNVWSTSEAFLAELADGEVVAWGARGYGGDISDVKSQLAKGIRNVWSADRVFLAELADGEVVAWGAIEYGGDISDVKSQLAKGIRNVWSADWAFLAELADGEVVAWGAIEYQKNDISRVKSQLAKGIRNVWSTASAFLAELADGEVVAWGARGDGGDISRVKSQLAKGIRNVWSTAKAFLAELADGEVVAWGARGYGGDISDVNSQLAKGIRNVWSTSRAFFAELADGEVVAWGAIEDGGDISDVKSQLAKGIRNVWSTDRVFLAELADGEVVAWGTRGYGGDISPVKSQLGKGIRHD